MAGAGSGNRDTSSSVSGFSAVVTTGIYCRPGCSARPNPANVRHFDLAAAAEVAGYRACRRCRPYRVATPVDTEIAFASGFGSLRQFNRTVGEIFQASPRELRSRRRAADRLVADGGLQLRLAYAGPLAWDTMLSYLGSRSIAGVELVSDGVYRRTIRVGGDPGVIEVARGGSDHLLLTVHLPHWGGLIHVVQQVRRIFNLDFDLERANALLVHDALLGARIGSLRGLRVPGAWDPFEVGVRAIIGQQVTVAGAGTIIARVVAHHGTVVPGLGPFGLTHLFPTAEVLAGADLSRSGLTGARIAAIRNFARAVAGGQIRLDRSRPLGEQLASLVEVPGLGPWTANYVALRMGEEDAFPATDLGLRRGVEALTGSTSSDRDIGEVAERWRPWRAHAAIHLWSIPRIATASAGVA